MENTVAVIQREMQRKLGRCMLRLQQYERLLKEMVPNMAVAGPLEKLDAVRGEQVNAVRNATLGTLVKLFANDHMTAASAEAEVGHDARADAMAPDAPWMSTRFMISMSPEQHAQTRADLAELVAMRNDLVHHLIERFDISDADACREACTYLDSCHERIDDHCQRLKGWASSMVEAQRLLATFAGSTTIEDAILRMSNPGHSVSLSGSAIVECLRHAEASCRTDGWTFLDAAIRFIAKENRDEVPSRYGCKTWKQVLSRSGQFEIKRVSGSNGVAGHLWYRSRFGTS